MIRLAVALGASVILMLGCATTKHPDVSLKDELEAMYDTDQTQRSKMDAVGKQYGYDSPEMMELWKKQQPIDEANIKRLIEIIDKEGWPGRKFVGDKASTAAFLVLQHADYTYQKNYLPLLRKAVADGALRADSLALLEDRVLMREGKKQLYGSQLQTNAKGFWSFIQLKMSRM
jgi:uncharacterized protein DUF6624